jgi:hypothetical protein
MTENEKVQQYLNYVQEKGDQIIDLFTREKISVGDFYLTAPFLYATACKTLDIDIEKGLEEFTTKAQIMWKALLLSEGDSEK